ncbi:serine-rich adhesin for platelets-like [Eriocheir sinensis]|uniref:serine-rich adhesin for platelets-like n=1 Tax=Eriocheir sinensis TaxID=95602 RepID=UPI0021C57CE8|nr:serine-rich adhesin for platelets-like [Eriocheir sinensis]
MGVKDHNKSHKAKIKTKIAHGTKAPWLVPSAARGRHIPSAIGDDKVTLESSSSNLPDPSQGMPQDDCSPTPVLPFDGLDNSPPLSCAGGEVNVSSVLTHSTENSFETGHEDLSPLTNSSCYSNMGDLADDERSASTIKLDSVSSSPSHSNISCYSNIGNLADDERSASTIKLDSVSAPASHSKDHSRPLETTTQLQRPSVVTPTLPQDPVLDKHTPHACHSPNPILLEKSNQESSFSSPKILQYDQSPNSSAIPTSGTFASVTLVKSFSECPGELCDSLQELSLVKCEEHNCSLKESQSDSMEPVTSPSTPKYTVTDLQCVPAVPDCRQPGDNEPSSSPMKPDNSDSITSPMKPDNSDSITSPMKPDNSDSITSPMKPDNSDSITSPMKPGDSDSITSPMKPDNSDSITSPMKPGDSDSITSPMKPGDSDSITSPMKPGDSDSITSPMKPGDSDSITSPMKPGDSDSITSPMKPGDSDSITSPMKPDNSDSITSPMKPDNSDSITSPMKPDNSDSITSPMKPDNSDSITSPMKPGDSDSITSPMKPGDSDSITSPMKPDNSDSITSPMKPDNSDSITSPMKPDNSDSITSPMKPDNSDSITSPMKPGDSDSITSPMKPDNSDSITSPMKPGDSDSITSPMKPGDSDSITSPMKPGDSDSITSPMKPGDSDSITSPMKPGDSEAPDILPTPASRVPDMGHCCLPPSRPRECVGNLRVSGNDLTESPGILQLPDSSGGARELNASSSSFPASPSFNDTLEEINQFLKYGVEYGERGAMIPSNGTPQRHLNSRDPAECSPGKVACSPQDLNCASDESDNSPIYPERKPTDNSHREPSNCLVNPSPSPQHPDSGLREHCALPASPRFNDTLEEIEQFLKYGVDYEDTSASGAGSQGFINSSAGSSSCSSSFQPPLESTRASGAVTPVVNDEEKKPSLQQEQHSTATVSVKKTPLASPLHAKTLHATAAQSLPAATTKPGLARPVQRVTPTSRAQVCLPHSQPVKASVGSAMKASHIPKVMKSQPHTPTTSKLQPTASRVKLQLGSCVATPTPKAAGLPPHPQRRLAPRLLPKKPQAPTSDVRHQRAQWHKIVASPLAKELRNNPPPPLVVNIKSTSSQSPWHPPSTSCQQSYQPPTSSCNLFPNGGKVQRAAEGTPSPKVCHDVQDSRVLPVVNYKTGMSVVLNKKDNKENTRRQCCKPPTPVTEVKVIKHTGRMMVAKPRNTSQGGERTSLMEVSVHQPVYMD